MGDLESCGCFELTGLPCVGCDCVTCQEERIKRVPSRPKDPQDVVSSWIFGLNQDIYDFSTKANDWLRPALLSHTRRVLSLEFGRDVVNRAEEYIVVALEKLR